MIPKRKFVMGQTRALRGGDRELRNYVRSITEEAQARDLIDSVFATAQNEGDYSGALADAMIKRIVSYHNRVVTDIISELTGICYVT